MTTLVFLVDTSATMNRITHTGMSLLDVTKSTIETFLKLRSKDSSCRHDRYIILTSDDPPKNVKARWNGGQNDNKYLTELKSLEASGLSSMRNALKNAFLLLNTERLKAGTDHYGRGLFPFRFDQHAIIVCLTDGNPDEAEKLKLISETNLLGFELTRGSYRWDQRVYSIIFKTSAFSFPSWPLSNEIQSGIISSIYPTEAITEASGGQTFVITSKESLTRCLDSLNQNIHSGVMVNFENLPYCLSNANEDSNQDNQPWHKCKVVLKINRSLQNHWPIPECYWPDVEMSCLPPRPDQPIISFSCRPCEPTSVDVVPFDKYELEPSPLTKHILDKKESSVAWQVFVENSSKHSEAGQPFGYIKVNPYLTAVNLFVMPYDYPRLFSLLDELRAEMFEVTPAWRERFNEYLRFIPPYYMEPLKMAFSGESKLKHLNLFPNHVENYLSLAVVSHLTKVKHQAAVEFERRWASVGPCQKTPPVINLVSTFTNSLKKRPLLDNCEMEKELHVFLSHYKNLKLHADPNHFRDNKYKNPFDIDRKDLIYDCLKLRLNYMNSPLGSNGLKHIEAMHNIPIKDMSNYEEYSKHWTPSLREVGNTETRINPFGSPFKVKKMLTIDETDGMNYTSSPSRKKNLTETCSTSPSCSRKRTKGPFQRNVPSKVIILESIKHKAIQTKPEKTQHSGENSLSSTESNNNLTGVNGSPSEEVKISGCDEGKEAKNFNIQIADKIGGNILAKDTQQIQEAESINQSFHDTDEDVKHNDNIKRMVLSQVKRKGKLSSSSLELLKSLRGNQLLRKLVINRITEELVRFKRKTTLITNKKSL